MAFLSFSGQASTSVPLKAPLLMGEEDLPGKAGCQVRLWKRLGTLVK